jgi:hypothetical protein
MQNRIYLKYLLLAVMFFPMLLDAQDSGKIDAASILDALKAIKQKHEEFEKKDKTSLLQEVSAAAASTMAAVNYYQEAVRSTRFSGQNRETTQFNDWRRKGRDADRMKDKNWQEALRLHLYYLAITLRRETGTEVKDLLNQLLSYTNQLVVEHDLLQDQGEWMDRPLTDSIFVNWLQVGDQVAKLDKWEMVPGNFSGIYQQAILPELRKLKDLRAVEYWNLRIQMESNEATASGRNFDIDKFNHVTKPKLLWDRSQEMLAIGQKSKAATEMLAIIKNYPTHPSVSDWIEKLEKLVKDSNQTTVYTPAEEK